MQFKSSVTDVYLFCRLRSWWFVKSIFLQILETARLHDIGEGGENIADVMDEILHQFEFNEIPCS
jgi:hypothetical protein